MSIRPIISIIVPVYNAENELRRAVDSILDQTENNIEVILINDGSTDRSPEICDKYADKDKRVRVIHQNNSGVSAARNAGINAAQGEYVGFVDADDWIEKDMYESLIKEAENTKAAVIMCDAYTVYPNGRKELDTIRQLAGDLTITRDKWTPNLLLEMAGAVWRCIYNTAQIKSQGICFQKGIKFSEDRIFNLYAFSNINGIRYIKRPYYNRYVNSKSAVHRFHSDYFEACKKAADGIQKAITDAWDDVSEYQNIYLRQFITGAFSAINNYYYKTSTLSSRDRREAVKRLCEDKQLREAIRDSKYGGCHSQWILNRKYNKLITYARIVNLRHGR